MLQQIQLQAMLAWCVALARASTASHHGIVNAREATFVDPDSCAASRCCRSFVQGQAAETLPASGAWYFAHDGTEDSIRAIVPAENILASVRAVVHGWCMKWENEKNEGAEGEQPYLAQVDFKTCARGTAFLLTSPGAGLYERFWTGPAQPIAYSQSLSLTVASGQILQANVLVPKLPLTAEAPPYFSAIWFEACEESDLNS
mmetsp:Transcript_45130/g.84221  ORF Transcript_45130/g.84221 Transcript_45130/m.84221 type:complete len:202 (+) Transcript_45130:53-658(+)